MAAPTLGSGLHTYLRDDDAIGLLEWREWHSDHEPESMRAGGPDSPMARIASQEGLKPSIIDRLIDPESEGTSWRRGYSIEQMIDSVRKDLEDLLNSHQGDQQIPEEFVEVRKSIVAYGMPDLVSYQSGGAGRRRGGSARPSRRRSR